MIYHNNKEINGVYLQNKEILAIYVGTRLVWEKNNMLSCFAQGLWLDDLPWTDDLPWGDIN